MKVVWSVKTLPINWRTAVINPRRMTTRVSGLRGASAREDFVACLDLRAVLLSPMFFFLLSQVILTTFPSVESRAFRLRSRWAMTFGFLDSGSRFAPDEVEFVGVRTFEVMDLKDNEYWAWRGSDICPKVLRGRFPDLLRNL